MKLLLLALCFLLQTPKNSCSEYYEKELYPISFKGKVTNKEIKDDFYKIEVTETNGKKISFQLIRNRTGFDLFNFVILDSYITKNKGEKCIHVLTENKINKSIEGRIFENFCN